MNGTLRLATGELARCEECHRTAVEVVDGQHLCRECAGFVKAAILLIETSGGELMTQEEARRRNL